MAQRMCDLVQTYSRFERVKSYKTKSNGEEITFVGRSHQLVSILKLISIDQVLTGATGALGAFILTRLRRVFPNSTVVCLCRAQSDDHSTARVKQSLRSRDLACSMDRVACFAADFTAPNLGLSEIGQRSLQKATTVIHVS